jgi:predicted GNAT family acetyltransferase
LVAQLSQRVLDSGRRWCFLFADVENPTSNRIYRQIGYEAVAPMEDYRFE